MYEFREEKHFTDDALEDDGIYEAMNDEAGGRCVMDLRPFQEDEWVAYKAEV